jgi:xanthine dehydrogenase accessory factor
MQNLFSQIVRCLDRGQRIVLATIIRQIGSAPRPLGTSCIILEDGSLIGSVGGGGLEFQTIEQARKLFLQPKTALLHFNLTGTDVEETDMLCGGIVDVYLEPLIPGDPQVTSLFRRASEIADSGRNGVLLTRIVEGLSTTDSTCRTLIDAVAPNDVFCGTDWELTAQMRDKLLRTKHPKLEDLTPGGHPFFVQPVRPDDVLYIFGAGHISTHIAPIARSVGFRVVVIDDRVEFANRDRFPAADEIIALPFDKAFERVLATRSAYIAIVTRGHRHDHEVLFKTLNKEWAYVGMVGSRRKREIIYQSLIKEGVAEERLNQVHCPIGLPIGADTPEEIAVSIVAEIIKVRADHNMTR